MNGKKKERLREYFSLRSTEKILKRLQKECDDDFYEETSKILIERGVEKIPPHIPRPRLGAIADIIALPAAVFFLRGNCNSRYDV